jgi:hypothetical protein
MSSAPVSSTEISALLDQLALLETAAPAPEPILVQPVIQQPLPVTAPPVVKKRSFMPLLVGAFLGALATWTILPQAAAPAATVIDTVETYQPGSSTQGDWLDTPHRVLATAVQNIEHTLLADFSEQALAGKTLQELIALQGQAQQSANLCRAKLFQLWISLDNAEDRDRLVPIVEQSRLKGLLPKQFFAEPRPLYLLSDSFSIDFSFLARLP